MKHVLFVLKKLTIHSIFMLSILCVVFTRKHRMLSMNNGCEAVTPPAYAILASQEARKELAKLRLRMLWSAVNVLWSTVNNHRNND